jgi:MHS family proline/betaine transporter-like MFS transporter
MNHKNFRFSIFATIIGNCMEWFDYAMIGYIAPRYLSIYPDQSSQINPLFFIYGASLLGRPLGGILFSYLGDILGRRLILILSIGLMVTGSIFTLFLPSSFYFSVLTPMLLLLILIIHNISAGGEAPASITYLYEMAPKHLRPFATSWVYFGFFLGVFLSTSDFASLFFELSEEKFLAWGWKIPFLFSALIGLLGLFFRNKLDESPLFREEKAHHELLRNPLKKILTSYKKESLLGIMILFLDAVLINSFIIFGPTYLQTYLKKSAEVTLTLSVFSIMLAMLAAPLAGFLSTKINKLTLIKWGLFLIFVLIYPIYSLLQLQDIRWVFLANGTLAIFVGFLTSLMPSVVCDLFPTNTRCSGYGVCRNLPVPLIDGMVPIVLSLVVVKYGNKNAPAFLIMFGAIVTFVAISISKKLSLFKKESL